MSYQKCPICNGTGLEAHFLQCSVCGGQKIINEQTGLPPCKEVISSSTSDILPHIYDLEKNK